MQNFKEIYSIIKMLWTNSSIFGKIFFVASLTQLSYIFITVFTIIYSNEDALGHSETLWMILLLQVVILFVNVWGFIAELRDDDSWFCAIGWLGTLGNTIFIIPLKQIANLIPLVMPAT
ncbi:hypothetical protein J2045_001879 [Peteryoungia aggregata LMG 23059]|uniref:Uncharacterized protein n=1 Tax=Peteryoungia aggregata LMG 23059 TaxID=1368425 RepID=A0ABU0G687_9HYPH|nr:hypothetical protein [Peteryoungia aggregata]MDQ0420855.1 hypothetical protein [Peteryoungia aggregata LMG 23059]